MQPEFSRENSYQNQIVFSQEDSDDDDDWWEAEPSRHAHVENGETGSRRCKYNNDWLSVRTGITTEFYFGYSLYGSCFPVTHLVVTSCFNRFCKPEISKTLGNQKSHVVPLFCELSHVHLPLIVCFR